MCLDKRLRGLRAENDWTLHELALRAGLSALTVHRAESGKAISIQSLTALADIFEVSTDYLLGRDSMRSRGAQKKGKGTSQSATSVGC